MREKRVGVAETAAGASQTSTAALDLNGSTRYRYPGVPSAIGFPSNPGQYAATDLQPGGGGLGPIQLREQAGPDDRGDQGDDGQDDKNFEQAVAGAGAAGCASGAEATLKTGKAEKHADDPEKAGPITMAQGLL